MEITCHLFGHTVVRSVAFYDASKTYLSGYSAATDNGTFASTVTVPSGAKYTRFSYGVPGGAATTPADYINSAIASTSLSELVSEGYLPNQTFEPLTLDFTGLGETSGYIKTDGAQTTTSGRSEEHTSELQSLMRTSYAVFCSK